ncbi:hypothetical protein UJ101_02378 [Flavobacteriaceae bacterium UJ101]|nr:hypothetical protein UJ101_02378 [Flavobacteriaceae bacterium UJ101]
MIFKFRVILDSKEDIFRDIEVLDSQSFEAFHEGIYKAFGFNGQEMASFFISDNDWEQGDEISQMDMGVPNSYIMNKTSIEELADDIGDKFIYVYDLLNYWTFFVELIEIRNDHNLSKNYPKVITSVGQMLTKAPEKNFTSTSIEDNFDLDDELDDDFSSFENIDDFNL